MCHGVPFLNCGHSFVDVGNWAALVYGHLCEDAGSVLFMAPSGFLLSIVSPGEYIIHLFVLAMFFLVMLFSFAKP